MTGRGASQESLNAAFISAWRALETAQHSAKGASLVLRFCIRPMGRVFAAAAHVVGLSPNLVTCLSALVTMGGLAAVALWAPAGWTGLVAATGLVVGFGLDSADGQVARLSQRASLSGEWLDHVVDAAKMVLVHTVVLVGWYRFTDLDPLWLLVPLAFQVVEIVLYAGLTLVALIKRQRPRAVAPAAGRPSTLRSIVLLPVDYGVLGLSFLLWGAQSVFPYVYAGLLLLNVGILVALLVKWFRELKALDVASEAVLDHRLGLRLHPRQHPQGHHELDRHAAEDPDENT